VPPDLNFLSLDVMQIPRGTGTGFIWDDRGNVVTNFHPGNSGGPLLDSAGRLIGDRSVSRQPGAPGGHSTL